MSPRLLLRLEGAALFFCSLTFYRSLKASWVLFIALFLWPDLLMVGHLVNSRLGSRLYNSVHSELLPAALAAFAFTEHRMSVLIFALIWLGHIGFDRALGYGLKYPTFFNDTHLQRI
jgi:Domain of unknown function (DUF4260)